MRRRIYFSPSHIVIQSVAKDLGNIHVDVSVDVHEILPPFGRLDDKKGKSRLDDKKNRRCKERKEGGRTPATRYALCHNTLASGGRSVCKNHRNPWKTWIPVKNVTIQQSSYSSV